MDTYNLVKTATTFFKNIKIKPVENQQELYQNSALFYVYVIKIVSVIIDYYFFAANKEYPPDCSICHESLNGSKDQKEEQSIVTTICCHTYHQECLNKWLIQKRNCPMCRHNL